MHWERKSFINAIFDDSLAMIFSESFSDWRNDSKLSTVAKRIRKVLIAIANI